MMRPAMSSLYLSLIMICCLPGLACQNAERRSPGNTTADRRNLLIQPEAAAAFGYTINWQTRLALQSNNRFHAVRHGENMIVTVERPSNMVSAISTLDGRLLWRRIVSVPTQPIYAPVIANGRVLVNNQSEVFVLDARNGEIIRTFPLRTSVRIEGSYINGYMIFGGANGRIFAHDPDTGMIKWQYQLTAEVLTPPVAVGNNLFVGDANGTYASLNALTGRLNWRGITYGPISAPPAVDSTSVYIPSEDRSLYAVDRSIGRDRWPYRTQTPLTMAPMTQRLVVYLPVPGKSLIALNSQNGEERWVYEKPVEPVGVVRERLLVKMPGKLELLNPENGRMVQNVDVQPLKDLFITQGESLLLVAPDGRMHRLNPRR